MHRELLQLYATGHPDLEYQGRQNNDGLCTDSRRQQTGDFNFAFFDGDTPWDRLGIDFEETVVIDEEESDHL